MLCLVVISIGLARRRSHEERLPRVDDHERLTLLIDVPLALAAIRIGKPLRFGRPEALDGVIQARIAPPFSQQPLGRRVHSFIGLTFEDRQKLLAQPLLLTFRPVRVREFAQQQRKPASRPKSVSFSQRGVIACRSTPRGLLQWIR